jgi:head-to-tail connecting protein
MAADPRDTEKDVVGEILRRAESMVSDRSTLDNILEQVAARVLPQYRNKFLGRGINHTEGLQGNELMYDATASLMLPKFGAVMEAMVSPRSSKYHRLVPPDKTLLRNRAAREWFEDTNDKLFAYRYAPQANFASQKQEDYIQQGAFGTGPLFIDRLVGAPGIRYKSCSLADTYFQVNHQGIVDTVYRRIPDITARQAVQRWGKTGRLPEEISRAAERTPEQFFEFWHCVEPRDEVEYGVLGFRGMAYASRYVSKTGKAIVEEGGYRTFPYTISRHLVGPGEIYGRGPAMLVLPNIKVLNEQKRTVLKQGHRAVDPVLLAHDDGVIEGFSMKPGAVNYGGVNADGRALVHALPVGDLALAKEMMQEERQIIKDAFYITLFEILVEDRRDMTATEVLQRAQEKGILLAPTMGRQLTEGLGPQIVREVDLLAQQGRLLPLPAFLQGAAAEYKVEYDSPLSRAMKAEEVSGFTGVVEMAIKVAAETQDPSALDWIDFDVAMPEIADIRAVPVRWIRTLEQVQSRRQGRSQQQQTQTLIDALPGVAGLAKATAGK